MQSILDFIIWSPDPEIFTLPFTDHPVVWYGLLFAGGFILSQQVMFWLFKKEGRPERDVETLTMFMIIATVIGARLGHCLFYNPKFYLSNPIEILKVWEGGLASHGGALGILLGIWLYSNYDIRVGWKFIIPVSFKAKKEKREGQSFLWVLDRLVIVVALTGAMIRTGNFINSEMEGTETKSRMGVVYARYTKEIMAEVLNENERVEKVTFEEGGDKESEIAGRYPITAKVIFKRGEQLDETDKYLIENSLRNALLDYSEVTQHVDFGAGQPLAYKIYEDRGRSVLEIYGIGIVRHAAQLYEATYCILLMVALFWFWKNKRNTIPQGFNFAFFMIVLWSLRFVDEFFKMSQEAFEDDLLINMGQILSIPLTLAGILMMILFYKKQKVTMGGEPREI